MEPDTIIDLLRTVTGTHAAIGPDTDLFATEILDSLGLMQLVIALSDASGIDIPPGSIQRTDWTTVRAIQAYLDRNPHI